MNVELMKGLYCNHFKFVAYASSAFGLFLMLTFLELINIFRAILVPPKLPDDNKDRKRTITNGSNEVENVQNEHSTSRTPDSEPRPKSANLSPSLDCQRVNFKNFL